MQCQGQARGLAAQRQCAQPPQRRLAPQVVRVVAQAQKPSSTATTSPPPATTKKQQAQPSGAAGLGDLLGPIGLTYSASVTTQDQVQAHKEGSGLALGPISLSFGTEFGDQGAASTSGAADGSGAAPAPSIHSMTTEEWRTLYEKDGTVDLWVEEEFNAGSRLVGGRAVHKGGMYGFRTGEGVSGITAGEDVAVHKVKIFDHYKNQELELEVPEDRYILWEAEDKGLELPYACRMGCCTACAVRVTEGSVYQPEALGISQELKDQGYALMCVGFPTSDAVMETVSEDEIYDLQFGQYFAAQAVDPSNPDYVERDDYALSIANMDE